MAFAIALLFSVRDAAAQQPPQSRLAFSEVEEWPFAYNGLARHPSIAWDDVPVAQLRISSTGGVNMFHELHVEMMGSTSVRILTLYSGNQHVATTGVTNRTSDDFLMARDINPGVTETFTIMAWFYEDAPTVSPVTRARITKIGYYTSTYQYVLQDVNILGPVIHCFAKYADYRQSADAANSITVAPQEIPGTNARVVATFPLTLKALGGIADAPKAADFDVTFTDVLSGQQYPATAISLVQDPSTPVPDGTTRGLVVTASVSTPNIRLDGLYHAKISRIRWKMNGAAVVAQDWGLERMVTPVTNVSMPTANAFDILASRLGATDQDLAMIVAAPNQDFFIESSGNLSDWMNLGLPIGTAEVAILPNRLKVFRVPIPDAGTSMRRFLRIGRP